MEDASLAKVWTDYYVPLTWYRDFGGRTNTTQQCACAWIVNLVRERDLLPPRRRDGRTTKPVPSPVCARVGIRHPRGVSHRNNEPRKVSTSTCFRPSFGGEPPPPPLTVHSLDQSSFPETFLPHMSLQNPSTHDAVGRAACAMSILSVKTLGKSLPNIHKPEYSPLPAGLQHDFTPYTLHYLSPDAWRFSLVPWAPPQTRPPLQHRLLHLRPTPLMPLLPTHWP